MKAWQNFSFVGWRILPGVKGTPISNVLESYMLCKWGPFLLKQEQCFCPNLKGMLFLCVKLVNLAQHFISFFMWMSLNRPKSPKKQRFLWKMINAKWPQVLLGESGRFTKHFFPENLINFSVNFNKKVYVKINPQSHSYMNRATCAS